MRHDLDARRDRRRHLCRWTLDLVEHAIEAVAHAQTVFEGLDVDVARLRLDRAPDQLVDEADDRRVAGDIPETLGIVLEWRRTRSRILGFLATARIEPLECCFEFDRQSDRETHGLPGGHGHGFRREQVQGIGDGKHEPLPVQGHRHRARCPEKRNRQGFRPQGLGRIVGCGDHRQVQKTRVGASEVPLRHEPKLAQHHVDAAGRSLPRHGGHAQRLCRRNGPPAREGRSTRRAETVRAFGSRTAARVTLVIAICQVNTRNGPAAPARGRGVWWRVG